MARRISFNIENDTLHISIPVEFAETMLPQIRELLDAIELSIEGGQAEKSTARDSDLEKRRSRLQKIGVQLYRQYRRITPKPKHHAKRRAVFVELGRQYGFDGFSAQYLTFHRRRIVMAYAKKRRFATTKRLYEASYSHRQIAARIGRSEGTVGKYLREIRRAKS